MTDEERILQSVKDTLQKIALMESEQVLPIATPDSVAWTIGKAVKNALIQMKGLGLLPEGFRFGDITVDYNRTIPNPKFHVQVQLLQ